MREAEHRPPPLQMNPPKQFFGRTLREWRLFLEALRCLAWAKILVHTLPFPRLARRLGQAQTQTAPMISPGDRTVAVQISWAVQAAARHVPLGFVCLPQAMAAQRMLRRRGLATTLYFSAAFAKGKKARLQAHAWLRAGDKIVTGEEQMAGHPAVAWFGDTPQEPHPERRQ
jgi:hypothetical protein